VSYATEDAILYVYVCTNRTPPVVLSQRFSNTSILINENFDHSKNTVDVIELTNESSGLERSFVSSIRSPYFHNSQNFYDKFLEVSIA